MAPKSMTLDASPATSKTPPPEMAVSIEDSASFLSRWTLSYLTPILRFGATKALEVEDLGAIPDQDEAMKSFEKVFVLWNEAVAVAAEKEGGDGMPSLASTVLRGFGAGTFYLSLFYYVIAGLLGFVPVILLGDIVRYFEEGEEHETIITPVWLEIALLGIVPAVVGVLQTRNQVLMTHFSVFAKTSISMLLYKAALTASSSARGMSSTGEVINIMSNDTAQIQRFLQFLGLTLVAPLQIIVAIYLIYKEIGDAVWVGVGFMIFLGPINSVIFALVSKLRKKVLHYSDQRVKLMSEILSGIRIIKFNAWEKPFHKQIDYIRGKEMAALTKMAYVIAIGFSLILMSAPIIQPILVFATYVYSSSQDITAAKAFTVIALFNIMRFPFAFLPMGLVQFAQAKIASGRITKYLTLPRLSPYIDYKEDGSLKEGEIVIDNATFAWSRPREDSSATDNKKTNEDENLSKELEEKQSSVHRPILTDISCQIPQGSCVAVVGGVGSGKSSFLSAITGEMELLDGSVSIGNSLQETNKKLIAYSPQTPFITNETLRLNILFNRNDDGEDQDHYNKTFYNKVLEAACLSEDLSILPSGDLTEIGERGINLSGGQKSRVALARCMYSRASVWLMDDPLSAVDAHVGQKLMQSILDPPRDNDNATLPTRILVTHHVHVLPMCDFVIVLDDGKVQHMGHYEELIAKGVDFAGAMEFNKEGEEEEVEGMGDASKANMEDVASLSAKKPTEGEEPNKKQQNKQQPDSLTTKEERATGSIDFSAYLLYAKLGGYFATFLTIFAQALGRGFEIGSSFWLSYWAAESFKDDDSGRSTTFYLNMYALISMCSVLMTSVKSILIARHRLKASTKLHSNLSKSILAAPISFFDVTPIGRVLNRFSADMDRADLELASSWSQAISTVFSIIGGITAIIAATKGVFLGPLIPLAAIYWYLQSWFRKSSTELQRVVSITASPIFVDFSETLHGITTIRAYGLEKTFFDTTIDNFNINNVAYLSLQHSNSWLGLRLDVLGGFIAVFVGGLSLATKDSGFIPAGWLGLSLTYANELSQYLKHGVRMLAQVEADMSSIQRIIYYSENVEPEALPYLPKDPPSAGTKESKVRDESDANDLEKNDVLDNVWPANGNIELQNMSMRYRDGPLILKNLNISIFSGERIGVVGRTGSGKSSLMNALFRIVELAEGKVIISGKNVAEIGTFLLRSNLGIIPQDSVLFSNTLRYNIDPFETAGNDEVWDILKKVQLDDVVRNLDGQLEEMVSEGGENFSQGQRQLICIARALLRKPKILIMDEATASIDNATDALIQQMIRENFEGATILTIAHRLNTIMDSDRVLVLDDGCVAEFDSPGKLLEMEKGIFRALVEKSRKSMRVSSKTDLSSM